MCIHITEAVVMAEEKARYDAAVKEALADKQVLARIMKYSLDEFKDDSVEDIIELISDDIDIAEVPVDPGLTNSGKVISDDIEILDGPASLRLTNLGKVTKESEEDNVLGEGMIRYDIRFTAIKEQIRLKVLINVEGQKSTDPGKLGYHIDNRIIYYLSRMISAQKNVEFFNTDYDNIKPVRSIWICMDAKDDEDSVNRIEFRQNTLYGKDVDVLNINKVQAIIIRLRKNCDAEESKNALIAMLETLFGNQDSQSKCKSLEEKYGFVIKDETTRRINTMCNLSDVVEERGIKKGIEKGIEKEVEKTVRRLLIKNYPDGEIMDITECSKETLERIKKEMGKM